MQNKKVSVGRTYWWDKEKRKTICEKVKITFKKKHIINTHMIFCIDHTLKGFVFIYKLQFRFGLK